MMLTTQEDLCLNSNYLMGQETFFFCFCFGDFSFRLNSSAESCMDTNLRRVFSLGTIDGALVVLDFTATREFLIGYFRLKLVIEHFFGSFVSSY